MSSATPATARRQVRRTAACFLALGAAAVAFDLLSRNPEQLRYVLGAVFLTGLSAVTLFQARD